MKTVPYRYQLAGARLLHRHGGRAMLCDDPGLGKTLQSLMYAERHPECLPALVVCPAHLKDNWAEEVGKHLGLRAQVLSGMTPLRKPLDPAPHFVIINYDILEPWVKWLRRCLNPGLVIFDEAHYLQSRSSLRTRKSRILVRTRKKTGEIVHHVDRVIALTGTPMLKRPADMWPVLNIVWPDEFPSFTPFGHEFCGAKMEYGSWNFDGANDLPRLHDKLVSLGMIRRRKEDVLKDLPPKLRCVVPLPMSDRRRYEKADRDFVGWLAEEVGPGRMSSALRAESLTKVGYLKRLTAELKLKAVIAWVKDFLLSERKLLLFAVHKTFIRGLHKAFPDAVVVTGATPSNKRQGLFRHFTRTDCPMLIGNIRAAGTGWSAPGVSDVAFAEFDWVPSVHTQAGDRAHGLGRGSKTRQTTEHWLVARGSIEERIARLIQQRQRRVTEAVDGGDGETLSVYDLLLEELRKE